MTQEEKNAICDNCDTRTESACCGASLWENDICLDCKEHSEPACEGYLTNCDEFKLKENDNG